MKNTAWHNNQICQHILNTNFPPLNQSGHFKALKDCIDKVESGKGDLLDVGCCKAEFADTFPEFDYCGADLEHIIENVSKRIRPLLNYHHFDANTDDYSFMQRFDIVLMNGFLSEMPNAMEILESVLKHAHKYILIHRQDIAEKGDVEHYQTYGGLDTINYVMNRSMFEDLLKKYGCKIVIETEPFKEHPEKRSLLISK